MSEDKVNLNEIDHTKQTVSLGTEEQGPFISLMRGHVDAKTFVQAFRAEGWNGPEPHTPEELESEANAEKDEIKHTYGIFDSKGAGRWQWNADKDAEGAEPITVRYW